MDVGELLLLPEFKIGSGGISPSFILFFCFIRLFWNHIFTCVSFSCKAEAISMRLALVRYLLKWNSFSSSVSCLFVKLVLPVLRQFRLKRLEALEPKHELLEAGFGESIVGLFGEVAGYSAIVEVGSFGAEKKMFVIITLLISTVNLTCASKK